MTSVAPSSALVEVDRLALLERAHGALEHARVEVEADFLDLARLRFAQHFARAADLQVVHRQVEARAELLHHLDRFEALLRLLSQGFLGRNQQIGVRLVVRAADAAAQLVQLREAEPVGAVDDDGVGVRVVDAGLDDGRAQQHVVPLLRELAHHALQLALAHLAVRDRDARLRQQAREPVVRVLDGVDLVVQVVDLPAAAQLAQHRLADQAVRMRGDEGLDGEAPLRRGGDDREVAQAFQRQRQRARDRRRGEREHVHLGAQALQRFLLVHAEAVLLVDDDQAEALELDVAGQQLVGADDDVDLARCELLQHLRRFLLQS